MLLMSYLNPLLAFGIDELVDRSARSGVSGFIVPDLPLEECALIKDPADSRGLALVQMVSPVTPAGRMVELCRASRGFVYAVTTTGITGGEQDTAGLADYLGQVRAASSIPICAGFGIRHGDQVRQLAPYVDGVIVGSALLEAIEQGTDPAGFLEGLVAGSGS